MFGPSWSRARAAPKQDRPDIVIIGADSLGDGDGTAGLVTKTAYTLTVTGQNAACCATFRR